MSEIEPRPSTEDYVKQILSWASIAYAFGFVTVTLHTWRLGLPVIELLHPIYVWIGLPLATVAFFFKHIAALFRKRSRELAEEIRVGWSYAAAPDVQGDLNMVADFIGILKALLPGFGVMLSQPLIRISEALLLDRLQQAEQQAKTNDRQRYEKMAKLLRRFLGVFRVVAAIQKALNLVGYAVFICLALALYVWVLYPKIPQSLGGGKPSAVSLVAEATAIPKNLVPEYQSPPSNVSQSEKETVNLPVTLLYLTKDAYFVQTKSGARMSIKADAVKSVIWVQPTDQLLPDTSVEPTAIGEPASVVPIKR